MWKESRNMFFNESRPSWYAQVRPSPPLTLHTIPHPNPPLTPHTIPHPSPPLTPHTIPHPSSKKVILFPKELQLANFQYPVPAYPFTEKGPDITPMLKSLQIFVSPNIFFTTIVKDIWKESTVNHTERKEVKKWLAAPSFDYWPQQLNFAVWCATSGCGVSITDPQVKTFPPIIQGLLRFHVYFTVRRILYELGAPLPETPTFKQKSNHFNITALRTLCIEFGLPYVPEFRWKGGENQGLGRVWARYYPSGRFFPGWDKRIKDSLREANRESMVHTEKYTLEPDGLLNWKFLNDAHHGMQYNWFASKKGEGITKAGMVRLDRSIEAFVYCVLGAQADTGATIAGISGGETRQHFQENLENAIIVNDIKTGIQNYNHAVDKTHSRLNLAVVRGLWLLPSNLIINTESVVGYNNGLQKTTADMSFGVNPRLNETTHKRTDLSKDNSSDIDKSEPYRQPDDRPPEKSPVTPPIASISVHEGTLIAITIAAAAAGWWMFR